MNFDHLLEHYQRLEVVLEEKDIALKEKDVALQEKDIVLKEKRKKSLRKKERPSANCRPGSIRCSSKLTR